MHESLREITEEPVHARNFPVSPLSVAQVREAGYHREDLWLPSVVARSTALEHNARRFARWCREQGVELAPHGKTSMAPQLWHQQLEHGAWGITAATVSQARTMHAAGVRRVLIANEVLDPDQALWLARTVAAGDLECFCLVDSEEGAQVLAEAAAAAGTRLSVLLEFGVPGRRTGIRGLQGGLQLARAVRAAPHLRLAGVEGYEGVLPGRRTAEAVEEVASWLAGLVEVLRALERDGAFEDVGEVLLSAGGSAFPDLAASALSRAVSTMSTPVRPLIRSGCYLTHDHQSYERSSPLRSDVDDDPLIPALTCLSRVVSAPEPGLALLTAGKRDMPVDIDLPTVLRVLAPQGAGGATARMRVTELNDHHTFVSDPDEVLRPGDVVELGLSHPCTTFDKWPLIPVLDDEDRVIDALRTLF